MNLYAVLSDIHANYEALKAVVKDARRQANKAKAEQLHFVCLGDVVDYGPQPNECMDWVIKNVKTNLFVRGNHDQDVITPGPPQSIRSNYWPIHLWTRSELKEKHKGFLERHGESKQVSPNGLANFTLFHGSLFSTDGRIDTTELAKTNMSRMQTIYGLFGHTHFQGYFWCKNQFKRGKNQQYCLHLTLPKGHHIKAEQLSWKPLELNGDWQPLPSKGEKVLLNPGSVGQPRRHASQKDHANGEIPHDHSAAYLLLALNGNGPVQFQFRRVHYEVEKTIQLLRAIRYPENKLVKYAAIDQDRREQQHKDPNTLWEKFRYTQEHIHELLPRLIGDVLIPTLEKGR